MHFLLVTHDAWSLDDVYFSIFLLWKFEVEPISELPMPEAFLEFCLDHLLEERVVDVELLLIELSLSF